MTVSSSETELGFPLQTNDDKNNNNQNVRVDESVEKNKKKKKKKKSVNILKVALMLLRRRSRKSNNNPALDVASKGMWNRFVGAMRPLHLQSDHAPPTLQVVPSLSATTKPAPPLLHSSPSVDSFEDVSSSSSSVDSMSRYASAVNLQDMDKNDEEESNDEVFDNTNDEDEMIDAKAEMYIAQFYA
ncbi:unnamed protein product [Citrullus colocynthis]|uniref:Uncharacterized protein n=1 Tax=Citrullus colocynthis TaxID=252529 RepID=A0ABP0YPI9_9ROSI